MANLAPGCLVAEIDQPCSLVTFPAPGRFRFGPPGTQPVQVTAQVTVPAESSDPCGQVPHARPGGGVAVEQLIDFVVVGLILG